MATHTDATVCLPWRPADNRLAAHNRVRDYWNYHGFNVIEADSDDQANTLGMSSEYLLPFNLARARNRAVMRARTRYVIVADADTLPDIAAVLASLDEFDGVTWPYQTFRHIPGSLADSPDLMGAKPDREYNASVGGILVCKTELYWQLGGMDEKFNRGWGFEDNAFYLVAETLSRVRRQPGIVFSFNHFDGDPRHDTYRDMSVTNPHRIRVQLYAMCKRNPELMKELIR